MKKKIITISALCILVIVSLVIASQFRAEPEKEFVLGSNHNPDDCITVMNKDDEYSIEERDLLFDCLNELTENYSDYKIELNIGDNFGLKTYAKAYYQISENKNIDNKDKIIRRMNKVDTEAYENKVKDKVKNKIDNKLR